MIQQRSAIKTEATVPPHAPNNNKDNGVNVHSTQRVIIEFTAKKAASTPVKGCKSAEKLLPGQDIELTEASNSEPENVGKNFFIHNLNECLSLWSIY